MSTFTTIAELQRLTDRELDILLRSVTQRLRPTKQRCPCAHELAAIAPPANLLGMPLVADYLEEGLERLGISAEDAERGVL
jgi:hypothetical protein